MTVPGRPLGRLAANLLVLALYHTLSRLPFGLRYRVAMAAGRAIYLAWGKGRARLKHNLSLIAPGLGGEELEALAREVLKTIVRDWAALFRTGKSDLVETTRLLEVEGAANVIARVVNRGGRAFADRVVLAGIHMGSFGAGLDAFSLFQIPVYAPAESIRPDALLRLMVKLRSRGFLRLEPIERGTTRARMAQRMDCGWAVGVMVDIMSRRPGGGVACRVGDGVGWFETGAVRLALERQAVIFPIFVLWTGEKYRIVVEEEFRPVASGDADRDVEVNTRRLIEERIAPWIELHPGQWMQAPWAGLAPAPHTPGAAAGPLETARDPGRPHSSK
ncbi:MAG: hypothetical protein Q7T33_01445 [Dehalococcoidia bacterium]|nr:hypothetical protein [Dehalococcoidia bacterium]